MIHRSSVFRYNTSLEYILIFTTSCKNQTLCCVWKTKTWTMYVILASKITILASIGFPYTLFGSEYREILILYSISLYSIRFSLYSIRFSKNAQKLSFHFPRPGQKIKSDFSRTSIPIFQNLKNFDKPIFQTFTLWSIEMEANANQA